jgi:hypothetical protein
MFVRFCIYASSKKCFGYEELQAGFMFLGDLACLRDSIREPKPAI